MKKIISLVLLLFFISNFGFSQRKQVNHYTPVYEINIKTVERVASQQKLTRKTEDVSKYVLKYPVLEELEYFNKNVKYSMINEELIASYVETENYIIFTFINGLKYKVRKSSRIFTKL